MNDHHDQPLVRAYLTAVARHTSVLPEATRRELLADLREHIDVALAQSDDADEETVRQILDRLGRPETVADAALTENGCSRPEAESPRRTAVTLGLVVLSWPLVLVPAIGPLLALAAVVAAVVRLWKSAQWVRKEKRQATLLLLSPMVATPAIAAAFSLATAGLTPVAVLTTCAAACCLPVVAAVRLSRSAARVRV